MEILQSSGNLPVEQNIRTGRAARLLDVSQQTIIRAFDGGAIRGKKLPGSSFRMIPLEEMNRQLAAYDKELLPTEARIAVITDIDKVHVSAVYQLNQVLTQVSVFLCSQLGSEEIDVFSEDKPGLYIIDTTHLSDGKKLGQLQEFADITRAKIEIAQTPADVLQVLNTHLENFIIAYRECFPGAPIADRFLRREMQGYPNAPIALSHAEFLALGGRKKEEKKRRGRKPRV